ncbi:DUF7344 domain-containing protein [Halosolutus gelatinilyticus]|uniref:DUF7344 domain-containing protein n=1 Tax=Halosolutus gelatinilyticus TaxID=2931975 RepID=UPI001FF37E45|nr:transcriptional regulator [Halosolutus gelatinilyticus]
MIDKMFDALANDTRRRLLVELLDHNPRQVAEPPGVPREGSDRDDELTRIYHAHLPKLDDYGFIEWNQEEHVITKGSSFDEIRPALKLLNDRQETLPAGWV